MFKGLLSLMGLSRETGSESDEAKGIVVVYESSSEGPKVHYD